MEEKMDFDINGYLKDYLSDPLSIAVPEADPALRDCDTDPEYLTANLANGILNPIIDAIAGNPETILNSHHFDSIQYLLKQAPVLPTTVLSKIFDLIISGLNTSAEIAQQDLEIDGLNDIVLHKTLLEAFGFLLQWSIAAVETKSSEKSSAAPSKVRGNLKGHKSKSVQKDAAWDWVPQLKVAMEAMCRVLKLKLNKIFVTTSERDTFVGLFTRSVYLIMESEARMKNIGIRMHTYKVLCIAIKHHGHAFGAQTSIVQNLFYFEHLSEPMAELLQIMSDQYDYPQLTEEVLRDLSNKDFNNNDTRGPKSVSAFFVKLSEISPRVVLKQMMLLIKQLQSEAYTLRCAIIEVCGNLITDLSKQEERNDTSKTQMNAFFELLEERFLDINPYCRCRAIQVYMKLCDLEQKFPKRRQIVAELAMRSLEDKSSNVRRNAIKLMAKLVSTHPFSVMHGGQLFRKDWTDRLAAVETQIQALTPEVDAVGKGELPASVEDNGLLDEATTLGSPQKETTALSREDQESIIQKATEQAANAEIVGRLRLTRKYYQEAVRFIEVVDDAVPMVCQLLSAKNKGEVIEAMDFFVTIDAYKIEKASTGIRRMLRLIWTKGNSDEGKGVQSHLIDCYRGLFFTAPDDFNENDSANYVARNMISLTFGATPAELTCLEQLLYTMHKAQFVSELVVSKLWHVYGVTKQDISRSQRRGAAMVLAKLATAEPEIIIKEMPTLLRVGLGPLGRKDIELAKWTCLALRRMQPTKVQGKTQGSPPPKLPKSHAVILQLAALVETETEDKEWCGAAEQAIGAIYTLAKHPDDVCTDIVRRMSRRVFESPETTNDEDICMGSNDSDSISETNKEHITRQSRTASLTQLLFIVGHVAIKQIVHLESCEIEFKRRKSEQEKKKDSGELQKPTDIDAQELDLIGGTTEDDFTEAMAHIRERELLYGQHSLLSNFCPLVSEICANNTNYANDDLQAAATLCMAKLMCVSSEYCEQNLPLLITILEKSSNAVIRSNVVIALGDMAVSFNHLIDENTDFLYRRLNDNDASVKRTCLMTLTFLILAGQVKVKGQLGQMAKCLEDSDKNIADLSKMFFTELATKDNAVYNNFIDIFSLLTNDKDLGEDSRKRIIKFLASFIEKDKHAKQLAEKLAVRLQRCDTEQQWTEVAYTLSLLQHKNEDIQKTIDSGFTLVRTAVA